MDTIEIKPLDRAPALRVWHVRLNGNGETYDAICTVHAVEDDVAYVSGLMSLVPQGWHRIAALGKPELYRMGFRRIEYRRNGVDRSEDLTG